MVFSMVYYFLLPIGAAYFQDLYKIKVWGPVNVGILFALSEFVVAWGIAFIYARRANSRVRPDGGGDRPRRREEDGRPQMSSPSLRTGRGRRRARGDRHAGARAGRRRRRSSAG